MKADHAADAILANLVNAKSLMNLALELLDDIGAPGGADAHLDFAIHCVDRQIAHYAALDPKRS